MTVLAGDDLAATVAALPAGDPADWSVEQAREAIPALAALRSQVDAWSYAALAAFDAAGGARDQGHRSTADWLGATTRISKAGEAVHTARDLRDVLPLTMTALHHGAIHTEHVRAIRRALRFFAERLPEQALVDYAREHTAKELRELIDVLIQQWTPEDTDDDTDAGRDQRALFLAEGLHGWWHLQGLLDPATGQKLHAALEALSDPCGPDDPRALPARRADALAEIAERAMDTTDRPTGAGHVTLTLTPQQATDKLGVTWPTGFLASRTDVGLHTCAAVVSYVVAHHTEIGWEPVAVGVARRFATAAQRRALEVRDGSGCAHPGCTVPAWRCVAHHITAYNDGGPTTLSNLVLLCRYHHREVHRGKLRIDTTHNHATTTPVTRAPP